jgi:hypothetical protein
MTNYRTNEILDVLAKHKNIIIDNVYHFDKVMLDLLESLFNKENQEIDKHDLSNRDKFKPGRIIPKTLFGKFNNVISLEFNRMYPIFQCYALGEWDGNIYLPIWRCLNAKSNFKYIPQLYASLVYGYAEVKVAFASNATLDIRVLNNWKRLVNSFYGMTSGNKSIIKIDNPWVAAESSRLLSKYLEENSEDHIIIGDIDRFIFDKNFGRDKVTSLANECSLPFIISNVDVEIQRNILKHINKISI